ARFDALSLHDALPVSIYSLLPYPRLFLSLVTLEVINFFSSLPIKSTRRTNKSNIFGKIKMVIQSLAFAVLLIFWNKPVPLFLLRSEEHTSELQSLRHL